MALLGLDHFSIRTADVPGTRDFYVRVLGLRDGERPPFKFPGAWLYSGDKAVIHLIGIDSPVDAKRIDRPDASAVPRQHDTGAVDHLAFMGTDIEGVRNRLRQAGVPTRESEVTHLGLRQIFVKDPNGVTIEINFPRD